MITTDTGGRIVRLGAGAGFARDRIEPALDLARNGRLDYLIFECLAERTIALAHGGDFSLNDRQPHGLIVRIQLPVQERRAAA